MMKKAKKKDIKTTYFVVGGVVLLLAFAFILEMTGATNLTGLVSYGPRNVQPEEYKAFSDTTVVCGATIKSYKDLGTNINSAQQNVLDSLLLLQSTEINCEQGFSGRVANQCHMEYIRNIWEECNEGLTPENYISKFTATRSPSGSWGVGYIIYGDEE